MVHIIAMEVLPEERDRKYYADSYSCCPPPLFVIFVTLLEVSGQLNALRPLFPSLVARTAAQPNQAANSINRILGFQLGFFAYYSLAYGLMEPAGPVPFDSILIYRPDKRQEIWRFLTYMVLHAG